MPFQNLYLCFSQMSGISILDRWAMCLPKFFSNTWLSRPDADESKNAVGPLR